ncbi:YeiH family protein [Oxalobacteraceae bacterium A2-2]
MNYPNFKTLLPGTALCGLVTLLACGLEQLELAWLGKAWLESLVLAIVLGAVLRTALGLPERYQAGVHFSAKILLELAVLLLGLSVSAGAVAAEGWRLLVGIAAVVALAIALSYGIGRAAGLPVKMALLIACGNSICGNSAIAAVAPVIDADSGDVAAAIAFTAVLGVLLVLLLPLAMPLLSLSAAQYGVFAGLTVYAVPQVLAATASVSQASVHVGTLVKLVRVLMLGPVVVTMSLLRREPGGKHPGLAHMLPWFIVGFLLLMGARSAGWVPQAVLAPAHHAASVLTVMSMAALGLGVDARSVVAAGRKVAGVVVLSLLGLSVLSYGLIRLLPPAG